MTGKLVVFEGPDGVGKSTLSTECKARLTSLGVASSLLAFPGKEEGTLGKHVYDLHHHPMDFGVERLNSASLQLMHVAAHIDAIESRIKPRLAAGETVILDRYWWSTWVYGMAAGAGEALLERMLDLERATWDMLPDVVFLVSCPAPLRKTDDGPVWQKLVSLYDDLAKREAVFYRVERIENTGSIDDALRSILEVLGRPSRPVTREV